MQDADLFLELAAIAGVFVGFGALIAVRSSDAGPDEVGMMRGVMSALMLFVGVFWLRPSMVRELQLQSPAQHDSTPTWGREADGTSWPILVPG